MSVTARQMIIATEVVRYVNIINDLLDVVSFQLRRKNANDGQQLVNPQTGDPATLEEAKQFIRGNLQSAAQYDNALTEFGALVGWSVVNTALAGIQVDGAQLKAEYESMADEATYVFQNVDAATDWPNLIPLADRLDANVPKVPLIRRRWSL